MEYDIRGVATPFPFEAYGCQLAYMEKMMEALQLGQHALLESPTGTGKTLCLLSTALAWQEAHIQYLGSEYDKQKGIEIDEELFINLRNIKGIRVGNEEQPNFSCSKAEYIRSNKPLIIYASRTHGQIAQVMCELKKTLFNPAVAVLGSREKLCVNDVVLKLGSNLEKACLSAQNTNSCTYKTRLSNFKMYNHSLYTGLNFFDAASINITDIEDMGKLGKQKRICPFYLARDEDFQKSADILFVPYNFLVNPTSRKTIHIDWERATIIFDEAHNLESVFDEGASISLSAGDLSRAIKDIDEIISVLRVKEKELGEAMRGDSSKDDLSKPTCHNFCLLKTILLDFEEHLQSIPFDNDDSPLPSVTRPGSFIYELFQSVKINHGNYNLLVDLIRKGIDQFGKDSKLEVFSRLLILVFRNEVDHLETAESFKVHIDTPQEISKVNANASKRSTSFLGNASTEKRDYANAPRNLNYWCFSPKIVIKELVDYKVHNLILTSGTLVPLESFSYEMQIDFDVTLENPHVIDNDQILVEVVPVGPSGKKLNSTFENRSKPEYLTELGATILNFLRIIPDGVLVFFPSYKVMDDSVQFWKACDLFTKMNNIKKIVVEPRDVRLVKDNDNIFDEAIASNKGAVYFAVCRGKVSEGIDFSNARGRGVIVTGLPYPPPYDNKVILKKKYLDEKVISPDMKRFTGSNWYSQQATRAVNQAVGRVIRHRNDFGVILLCDERFAQESHRNTLSKWLVPYWNVNPVFGGAIKRLGSFFVKIKNKSNPNYLNTTEQKLLLEKYKGTVLKDTKKVVKKVPILIDYEEEKDEDMFDGFECVSSSVAISQLLPKNKQMSLLDAIPSSLNDSNNMTSFNDSKSCIDFTPSSFSSMKKEENVLGINNNFKSSNSQPAQLNPVPKMKYIIKPKLLPSATINNKEKSENKEKIKETKGQSSETFMNDLKTSGIYNKQKFTEIIKDWKVLSQEDDTFTIMENKIEMAIKKTFSFFLPSHSPQLDLLLRFNSFIPAKFKMRFDEKVRLIANACISQNQTQTTNAVAPLPSQPQDTETTECLKLLKSSLTNEEYAYWKELTKTVKKYNNWEGYIVEIVKIFKSKPNSNELCAICKRTFIKSDFHSYFENLCNGHPNKRMKLS